MQQLVRYFFQGLLILLPFVLTVYLVYLIFTVLNETLFSAIGSLLRILVPSLAAGWIADLAGGLLTLSVIIITGMFASFYFGQLFLSLFDKALNQVPLVRLLYNSLTDLFNALIGDNKRLNQPVAVSLMNGELQLLGFITRDDMEEFGLPGKVAVYLPQSYNFAGNLILVDKDKIQLLDAPASKVTTFIVSGGITGKN